MATTTAGNIFESSMHLQGERATESAHRKIELQSPADYTYLIANVTQNVRDKINKNHPQKAAPEGQKDEVRERVEQIMDEHIRGTFDMAKHSISINGMDSKEMEGELAKAQEGEGQLFALSEHGQITLTVM
jgi:kinetochor protein Mis14/NSL1